MAEFQLHEACQEGDKEKVRTLIKKKWDVNGFDDKHWTPLHCAANSQHLDLCKYLLSKGADPCLTTSNKATALHFLAKIKEDPLQLVLLKTFVEKGADPGHPNAHGNTPLHEAALRGAVGSMQFLIQQNAKIDSQNSYGETPLHQAIRGGNNSAAEYLIRKGARIDLVGRDGSALEQAKRVLDEETYRNIESLVGKVNSGESSIINYDTLPQAIIEMACNARIDQQLIDANFDLFTDIVRFLTGSKYLPEPIDPDAARFTHGDPNETFELEQKTGFTCARGGDVFLASRKSGSGKVIIKKSTNKSSKDFKLNSNELRLLKRCQHKNVITFLECYNLVDAHEIWTVVEYLEGGSLRKLIEVVGCLDESQAKYITKEILEALRSIHSKYVIHRDIKSHNITLTTEGDVKLIDFSLAMDLRKGSSLKVAGSALWMAPEIIRREPQSFPVDIWSLGITIIEMLNGNPPNAQSKLKAMYGAALGETKPDLENPDSYSSDLHHFLMECLKSDPDVRPTAEMLLQHRWLESPCSKGVIQELAAKIV